MSALVAQGPERVVLVSQEEMDPLALWKGELIPERKIESDPPELHFVVWFSRSKWIGGGRCSGLKLEMLYEDPETSRNGVIESERAAFMDSGARRTGSYSFTRYELSNGVIESEHAVYTNNDGIYEVLPLHVDFSVPDQVPKLPRNTARFVNGSLKLSLSVDHQILVVNFQTRDEGNSKCSNFVYIFDMHANLKELGQRPTLVWSASDDAPDTIPGLELNNITRLDTFISTENPGVLNLKAYQDEGTQDERIQQTRVDFFAADKTNHVDTTWRAMKSLAWTNIAKARRRLLEQSPDVQVLPPYGPTRDILEFAGLAGIAFQY